jgi:hypothetical protein
MLKEEVVPKVRPHECNYQKKDSHDTLGTPCLRGNKLSATSFLCNYKIMTKNKN